MNSVTLANKVWKKVKMHSVCPTPVMLEQFTREEAEDTPESVIINAIMKIQNRLDMLAQLQKELAKPTDRATRDHLVVSIGILVHSRFREVENDDQGSFQNWTWNVRKE